MSEIAVPRHPELETLQLTGRLPSHIPALATQPQTRTFVETMPDGTRVLYGADGVPIRQWNADGSIVGFDAKGHPVTETTADGAAHPPPVQAPAAIASSLVTDQPDGQGRPTRVTFPDGTNARYEYKPDGGRVVRYSTGVVTTENGAGYLVAERLPDGTIYNAFDGQGRPTGGMLPDGGSFRLQYTPDGPVRQPPGVPAIVDPVGQPVRQVTADGTTLDGFDGQNRPTSGTLPDGNRFTITYDAEGDSFQHLPDGTVVEYSPRGGVIQQVTADGTTFDGFDGQNRPTSGTLADGNRFTITYDAQGDSFQHLPDGTVVEYSPRGGVIQQVTADGTTLEGFDSQNRPTSGTLADGNRFTITYDAQGDSFQHFPDGTVVEYSPGGRVIRQVTADGTTLDGFDGQNRPTSGTLPDGTRFTITYDAQGDSFQHLPDGTVVEYSPGGRVIRQIMTDGTTFDGFDGQGRPTSGTLPDGTPFTITYDAQGDVFEHFSDGTTIEYDSKGNPIKTWTPEGTQITWAVDLPALQAAAANVAAQEAVITEAVSNLKATFTKVEGIWDSPAGMSLLPLVTTFNTVTDGLIQLLDEAVNRMRIAYQNYYSTESTNTSNLQ